MECTGERYMPEFDGDWTLEHVHRYLLACELARGKTVLDIACGDGYGSRMLADAAKAVIGVDISLDSLAGAVTKYRHPRLDFVRGSAVDIPLADASVDLVVSFETLEHLAGQERMLKEIRRVLRPGGLLLMSSPDKYQYSDLPGYANAYHVKELYRNEFEALLQTCFSHIRMLGQRVVFGSVIGSEDTGAFVSWRKGGQSRTAGLADAEYLIALAGDARLPSLPSSLFKNPVEQSDRVRDLKGQQETITKHLTAALDRIAWFEDWEKEARGFIAQLEEEKAPLEERIRFLEDWEKEARGYIAALETQQDELFKVYASRSWRVTAPLRFAAAGIRRVLSRKPLPDPTSPAPSPAASSPVGAWPSDVRALEKKLRLDENAAQSQMRLGVFLHIYYTDLTGELASCLGRLPETADIHVSTDSEAKRSVIQKLFALQGLEKRAEIRVCPNTGWDVAPFLVGFADRIPDYPLILRLHSKRSTHFSRAIGEAWRRAVFSSLTGSAQRVNAIMRAFENDSALGMVCPPVPAHYAGSVTFGGNLPLMKLLLRRHAVALEPDTPLDFPMGSMFWCRPESLAPWLDERFSYSDFTPTSRKERDGSLAHALERLFFFGCGITGHSWSRLES